MPINDKLDPADDHRPDSDEVFAAKAFVDQQVTHGGYGAHSEYIRELIRRDHGRLRLHRLLLDGADTAATVPTDRPGLPQQSAKTHAALSGSTI